MLQSLGTSLDYLNVKSNIDLSAAKCRNSREGISLMNHRYKNTLLCFGMIIIAACSENSAQTDNTRNSTLIVDEIPGRAVNDPNYPPGRLLHLAENGDVIFDTNMLKMPYDAVAMPDGTYWVSLIRENALWRINRDSEVVEVLYVGVYPTAFSVLDNGNILVSGWDDDHPGFIREYNADHDIVWQLEDLKWPWKAQRLENDNTLVADAGLNRVYEVTVDGTEVWSYDDIGPEVNELFDGLGRVAGRHRIGRDIRGHHGAGAHDAVLPDGDALADNGPVPDPDIIGNVDRSGFASDDTVV